MLSAGLCESAAGGGGGYGGKKADVIDSSSLRPARSAEGSSPTHTPDPQVQIRWTDQITRLDAVGERAPGTHSSLISVSSHRHVWKKIPLQVSPQEVTYQRRLSTRHTATQTHTSSSQSSSNYSNILVTSSYFLERNHPEDMNAAVITLTFDSTGGRNHGESLPKKTRALPSDPD